MMPKTALRLRNVCIILVVLALIGGVGFIPSRQPAGGAYIVQAADVIQAGRLVRAAGGLVTARLPIVNGVTAELSEQAAQALRLDPQVLAVSPDWNVHVVSDGGNAPATDQADVVGADQVWSQGVTGAGVTVAVVDTGLGWHPGIFNGQNGRPKGRLLAWKDFVDGYKLPRDPSGHGTHIAGIIANSQLGADGEWNGVAPGVSLVGVRVLNELGYGTYTQVIQGIQWVLDHRAEYNIRVLNLSLVSEARSPYWADPLNQAVMRAWAEGITVVAAAGNGGPEAMTIGVPGNVPYVVTVGAFTDNYSPLDWNDDYLAPFSSAGPTLDGFAKPDLVAPGAHIASTMMPSSYIARHDQATRLTPFYYAMAGTSQAAAVVSGVAALVLSQNSQLTPNQVKFRLMETAFPWVDINTGLAGYSLWQQGAGRVNAPDAVFNASLAEANSGLDVWSDLSGALHYEGFSYYDEASGQFRLKGEFSSWAGGYGAWAGGYGAWAGGYGAWAGGYGAWAGGYGAWAGGYGAWAGGYGAWAGGYGAWAGGYGAWAGGYGAWAGGYGAWAGSEPWAGSILSDVSFVDHYLSGVGPDAATTTTSVNHWLQGP